MIVLTARKGMYKTEQLTGMYAESGKVPVDVDWQVLRGNGRKSTENEGEEPVGRWGSQGSTDRV